MFMFLKLKKIFLHNIHRCNLKREGDVNYVIAMTLLGWGYMIITQPSCIGLCLDPESRIAVMMLG